MVTIIILMCVVYHACCSCRYNSCVRQCHAHTARPTHTSDCQARCFLFDAKTRRWPHELLSYAAGHHSAFGTHTVRLSYAAEIRC